MKKDRSEKTRHPDPETATHQLGIHMTHAILPELVPATPMPMIERQTAGMEELVSENATQFANAIANFTSYTEMIAQIKNSDFRGVLGHYDNKWEDDLMVDRTTGRHTNDKDERMLVYTAEHLARGSEMERFGSTGIMGYHTTAQEIQEAFLIAIEQPWLLDVYPTQLPEFIWLDFTCPSVKFLPEHYKTEAMALFLDRVSTVFLNQNISTWGLLHTLVHELTHSFIKAPHSVHGRFFRYAQLWVWANLDTEFDTLMAPKLASMYDQFGLSWEPVIK